MKTMVMRILAPPIQEIPLIWVAATLIQEGLVVIIM
jgi:hypothetical protein